MRNRFLSSFIVLGTVLAFAQGLFAQTPAKAQSSNPHDISGVWRMLAPGQTRARAQQVGSGASHPTLGNNRPPLTAWGQAAWTIFFMETIIVGNACERRGRFDLFLG